MATKKRGLGRGLDALLGPHGGGDLSAMDAGDELRQLPIDLVQRGTNQPRTDFNAESIRELADSIRARGVVQPIVVRPVPGGDKYEIVAGERRWRAAQAAGLHEVPALVRRLDDQDAMCVALIENIQREDLNPMEQARGMSRLLEEFGMTHEAIAETMGRSRSTITNLLRLLELHPQVVALVEQGDLEMGHARALLGLAAKKQLDAARQVVRGGLSVRATESLVRRLSADSKPAKPGESESDPDVRRLQNDLSEQLGAEVEIRQSKKGSGELRIRYSSLDQLDGIIKRLR